MPSITHESPIEVIRRYPSLAAELVRRLTSIEVPGEDKVEVRLGSADASNVVPAEFTADMVVLVTDKHTLKPLLLIVVEPQGREDKAKRFSWPAYLANLREAHECDSAVLIVVCWNEAEAEKCRVAIPMGHPGYVLVPIVIGPNSAPDLDGASPWLTVLCGAIGAIDLDTDAGRRAVLHAIAATHSNTPNLRKLTTIILAVASDVARLELEALMETTEFKSDFLDRIEASAEAKALMRVVKARGIVLTAQQHDLIMSCTDTGQLDTWLDRASAATSANDVFKD
jgi:hypothetical protein